MLSHEDRWKRIGAIWQRKKVLVEELCALGKEEEGLIKEDLCVSAKRNGSSTGMGQRRRQSRESSTKMRAEVLRLSGAKHKPRQIAAILGISTQQVYYYLRSLDPVVAAGGGTDAPAVAVARA